VNRNRPAPEAPWFTCYSLNPQVHAFDNVTDGLRTSNAQAFTVQSAKKAFAKAGCYLSGHFAHARQIWRAQDRLSA
jgi:hypothetical protein